MWRRWAWACWRPRCWCAPLWLAMLCMLHTATPAPRTSKLGRLTQHGTSSDPTLHAAGLWPLLPAAVVRCLCVRAGAGEPRNAAVQQAVADIHCTLSALHVGLQLSRCVLLAPSVDEALQNAKKSTPPHTATCAGRTTLLEHLDVRSSMERPDLQVNVSRNHSCLTPCVPPRHGCAGHTGGTAVTEE